MRSLLDLNYEVTYRREVIDGCRTLIAPHFNLFVELPLKAIVRGFRWKSPGEAVRVVHSTP